MLVFIIKVLIVAMGGVLAGLTLDKIRANNEKAKIDSTKSLEEIEEENNHQILNDLLEPLRNKKEEGD